MKNAIVSFVVAAAALVAGAAPQVYTVGAWSLTSNGNALSLARNGKTVISSVDFGFWKPAYQGMRFNENGLSARREGDRVIFAKSTDQAEASLVVTLSPDEAAFALDMDFRVAPGPFEYCFNLPLDSFRNPNGLPYARLGKKFFPIEEEPFGSRGDKTLTFDVPEAHHEFVNLGAGNFILQDRRAAAKGMVRSVVCIPIDEPQKLSFRHVWRVKDGFDAATVRSRAARYSVPPVQTFPLKLDNAGFEDGTKEWSLPSNARLDDAVAHAGKASVRLTVADPAKDPVYVTRRIPVVPGGIYRASCSVKTQGVTDKKGRMPSVGATLIVEWADANGRWIASGEYARGRFGTTDWQQAKCHNLKAPDNAGFALIYLALRGAGTAWFDDLALASVERSVEMSSPAPEAVLESNTPLFTWEDLSNTRAYTLLLAQDATFPKGATRTYEVTCDHAFQLKERLAPGVWYWTVTTPGALKASPRMFRVAAPIERDSLAPQILTRACRITRPDAAVTVRVWDEGATPPRVRCGAVAGTCGAADAQGNRAVTFAAPAGGWAKGFSECPVVAADAAGNCATQTLWLLNAPKPENDVVVDAHGDYVQNGTRIFPLGIYEVRPEEMREVRDCGFDVVHTYRWEGSQDDVACRKYLDACWAANGLRAFVGFDRGNGTGCGLVQGNYAHVARRVGALADHPGLFCWYLFDEPELLSQYVSPERLTAFADLVRALDPYHPVVMTTWNKSMINYRRTWDTHWTQAYGDPAGVVRQIDEHRAFLYNASPITLLVNCNDQTQGEARRRGVKPDPEKFARDYDHLRACAFLGIVKECNGVWWWWFARHCNDYYTAAQCPKAWEDMKKILKELISLRPLVTADGAVKTGTAVDGKAKVEWWRKTTSGGNVLIAVNTGNGPATVEIEGARYVFRRHEVKVIR